MNLDSLDQMSLKDSQHVYDSIVSLPDQMRWAKQDLDRLEIPPEFKLAKNVILAGMGGSALAGRMMKSLFEKQLRVPFEVITDFYLPGYVNEDTLVILSSYSGNTAETLEVSIKAKQKGAMIFGMTAGGKLKDFLQDNEIPRFIIDTKYNPSGQPRMSLGYTSMALVNFFSKCGFISITDLELGEAIDEADKFVQKFSARTPGDQNAAKMLAHKLQGKIAVLVSSEHLYEAVHPFKNQLNENSKNFSTHFAIPELNHHLMEGLSFPVNAKGILHFIFFESQNYAPDILKRYQLTKEVIDKQGYSFTVYNFESDSKFKQVIEVLVLGSCTSFYLAMLNNIDPAPIPWVDYFKERLG